MVLRFFQTLICAILLTTVVVAQKQHEVLPKFQQHIVRDRETASSIAAEFNIKTKDFLMLNNFPDSVKLKPGQKVLIRLLKEGETAEKEDAYYTSKPAAKVSEGEKSSSKKTTTKKETETTSSATYDKSNPLVGPNGATYELSGGGFHVVQKGQTFYRIALIYHLSIDQLKALNNMTTTDIKVGQELRVTK
jgi:LysM repeat protein